MYFIFILFLPVNCQSFLLEPERKIIKSGGMKESGLFLKKSTLIWDGNNKKNKKSKDNKTSKKLKSNKPKMSFFARLRNKFSGQKDDQNVNNIDDIESGVEMSRRDRDSYGDEGEKIEEEEDEEFSDLILGDTEESHLMSVFRAQVNVSEARINVLENELKLLRETNRNNNVYNDNNNNNNNNNNSIDDECKEDMTLRIDTNHKNKLKHDSNSQNSINTRNSIHEISLNDDLTDNVEIKSNLNSISNLQSDESHDNITQSTITDATDEEWHSTYNPLTPTAGNKNGIKVEKDTEEGVSNGGSADRLLTLSRISLQAKEGKFNFIFIFLA